MAESRPGHQNQLIQLHASQSFSPPWHIDNDHLHITLYTLFLDDYKYQEIMMPILWTAAVTEIIVVILNHMYATEINLSSPSTDMLSTLIYVLLHFPFAYTFIKACCADLQHWFLCNLKTFSNIFISHLSGTSSSCFARYVICVYFFLFLKFVLWYFCCLWYWHFLYYAISLLSTRHLGSETQVTISNLQISLTDLLYNITE